MSSYVIVMSYLDRSGVLGTFGPYPTRQKAVDAADVLERSPWVSDGLFDVMELTPGHRDADRGVVEMTMHDERWTLGVAENGDVRLRDLKTGETWRYAGLFGLSDAIGKLADWRKRERKACDWHQEHGYGWKWDCRGCNPTHPAYAQQQADQDEPAHNRHSDVTAAGRPKTHLIAEAHRHGHHAHGGVPDCPLCEPTQHKSDYGASIVEEKMPTARLTSDDLAYDPTEDHSDDSALVEEIRVASSEYERPDPALVQDEYEAEAGEGQ